MNTKSKKPRPTPTIEQCLIWLEANHPALAASSEIDRSWVWLPVNLRGDEHKDTRESLKEYGFRWAKRGHALPSGRMGTWGHACLSPIPFFRRGKGGKAAQIGPSGQVEAESIDAGLLAELAGV